MINIPFLILLTLGLIGLCAEATRHGQYKEEKINVWSRMITFFVELGLILWAIYWGGLV